MGPSLYLMNPSTHVAVKLTVDNSPCQALVSSDASAAMMAKTSSAKAALPPRGKAKKAGSEFTRVAQRRFC